MKRGQVVMPLLLGLIALAGLMRNPRLHTFRTVDVLQLLGTGMCFGVALTAAMFWLVSRSSSSSMVSS